MCTRLGWLLPALLGLGCQTLPPLPASAETPSAVRLWEDGQAAMRQGRTDDAIRCYEESLRANPNLARNHLSLAAAHLQVGDESRACPHLAQYVAAQPEHVIVRLRYADLLLRMHQPRAARAEFERFDADAQDHDEVETRHLIHCHSRLMEVAEQEGDDYAEHLHRGIGLFFLARERDGLEDPDGPLSTEGLLCKAAAELTVARALQPAEARPCWYLAQVWSRLAQQQPARRWLRAADAAAPFSYLTPAEQRALQFACLREEHTLRPR
jgi:tetratricopeptide (TPR) repeat protein